MFTFFCSVGVIHFEGEQAKMYKEEFYGFTTYHRLWWLFASDSLFVCVLLSFIVRHFYQFVANSFFNFRYFKSLLITSHKRSNFIRKTFLYVTFKIVVFQKKKINSGHFFAQCQIISKFLFFLLIFEFICS